MTLTAPERAVLTTLCSGPWFTTRDVIHLAPAGLSTRPGVITSHLQALARAHYVDVNTTAKATVYRINPAGRQALRNTPS
ncbi:MAG: hypothetical protein H0X64_06455 [Gemmatimonadaceae bacterium]|nr:hypothetical protein [Gemmatimonadaceae bacterium]